MRADIRDQILIPDVRLFFTKKLFYAYSIKSIGL